MIIFTIITLPVGVMLIGAALLGAVIGSFLGVVLVRLPEGRSVIQGRSACDGCAKTLTIAELIPVLSWILQNGKCRTCGVAIGVGQFACELGGAAIGIGAVLFARDGLTLAAMFFGWQLLLLGLLDLRHFWLPRVLVVGLALSGAVVVLMRVISAGTLDAALVSLGGGALGYAMLWATAKFYLKVRGREGMGAGDPPLMAAIGLWLGPLGVVEVLLGASILGILISIVILVSKRNIAADTALPLGTFLAATAWPMFLLQGLG